MSGRRSIDCNGSLIAATSNVRYCSSQRSIVGWSKRSVAYSHSTKNSSPCSTKFQCRSKFTKCFGFLAIEQVSPEKSNPLTSGSRLNVTERSGGRFASRGSASKRISRANVNR